MAIREILIYPDKRLHLKAEKVKEITDEIRILAADMAETMAYERGCGLAATQINVQKRVIVMDLSVRDEPSNLLVFVNPEIISRSGQVIGEEACLSVPGVYEKVVRAENVVFKYQDLDGKWQEISCNGLMSVCIQHEIDHLDGIVYVDYLSMLKQNYISKKLRKIYKPK